MLIVIAEIHTREGIEHKSKVINAFRKITATVLAESGCHGYELLVDADTDADFQCKNSHVITMLEYWESMQHLQTHLETAHMQAYQSEVQDDVLEVKIRILEKGLML
ncbi:MULTISPECIES: putative quinol monooxygenase [unclassified Acinetobacter]|uniref:putative quinol monooxygenase n=1 Tax=unclassified Acinetobacter TaxID=196816 RepID=UPI002577CE1B|nr:MULTISPECIES: putative quinol monooxygenase [unclassified Acinetobacter]MDM1763170.1 antibiotic biosynthesis monooxygenase [Acinetobacter sp. 226-1]MDM1766649.1 antibiotic biosynthesis monooxygenase [Acinetobacter sp. 226-4]